jgi:hypothetical protein
MRGGQRAVPIKSFIFLKVIERIGTHRSKDRVFRLSLEIILRAVCSLFFDQASSKSQFTIIPLLCPSTTKASTQHLQTHPPLPRAFLVRHSSLNYREFKTDKLAGTYFPSLHSSHLKPIQTTSAIPTRTLSNLFAKRIVIPFCTRELHA